MECGNSSAENLIQTIAERSAPMTVANLLLVDDEQPFVDIMTRRLVQRDFAVSAAFSGQEALDRLGADGSVDVVVLDVRMPGMDGIETVRRIKKAHPLIEIVMLTGHATVETAVAAIQRGAFDYLMKPCNLDELILKVGEALKRKKAREGKILEIRMRPYLSQRDKDALIDAVLDA
jgi:DNA-binding NtrC family response regulator